MKNLHANNFTQESTKKGGKSYKITVDGSERATAVAAATLLFLITKLYIFREREERRRARVQENSFPPPTQRRGFSFYKANAPYFILILRARVFLARAREKKKEKREKDEKHYKHREYRVRKKNGTNLGRRVHIQM